MYTSHGALCVLEKILIVGLVVVCMTLSFGCVDNNDTSSAAPQEEIEEPSKSDNIVRRYTETLVDKHIELGGEYGGRAVDIHGPLKEGDKITFTLSNIEGGSRAVYFDYPLHDDVYVFKEGTYTYELDYGVDSMHYIETF